MHLAVPAPGRSSGPWVFCSPDPSGRFSSHQQGVGVTQGTPELTTSGGRVVGEGREWCILPGPEAWRVFRFCLLFRLESGAKLRRNWYSKAHCPPSTGRSGGLKALWAIEQKSPVDLHVEPTCENRDLEVCQQPYNLLFSNAFFEKLGKRLSLIGFFVVVFYEISTLQWRQIMENYNYWLSFFRVRF